MLRQKTREDWRKGWREAEATIARPIAINKEGKVHRCLKLLHTHHRQLYAQRVVGRFPRSIDRVEEDIGMWGRSCIDIMREARNMIG